MECQLTPYNSSSFTQGMCPSTAAALCCSRSEASDETISGLKFTMVPKAEELPGIVAGKLLASACKAVRGNASACIDHAVCPFIDAVNLSLSSMICRVSDAFTAFTSPNLACSAEIVTPMGVQDEVRGTSQEHAQVGAVVPLPPDEQKPVQQWFTVLSKDTLPETMNWIPPYWSRRGDNISQASLLPTLLDYFSKEEGRLVITRENAQAIKDLVRSQYFDDKDGYKEVFESKEQGVNPEELCEYLDKVSSGTCPAFDLFFLRDTSFQKILQRSTSHPKLFEMFRHVYSTVDFISSKFFDDGILVFTPLKLYECTCPGTGAFFRFGYPRRTNLENGIVLRLAEIQTDKNQPTRLLSLGSGGLMSEFIILEKLVLGGFKKIEIDCVDTAGISPYQVERIRKFFDEYQDVSIDIRAYQNIDDIPVEKKGYGAVIAIDYDSLTGSDVERRFSSLADLMKARRRLSEKGFLGLGYSRDDTLSGPRMDPIVITFDSSFEQNLVADLTQQLKEKEELLLAIPNPGFAGMSHIFAYALALANEKSANFYRKISLSFLDGEERYYTSEFKTMLEVLFPSTEVEINVHEKGKKYDLVLTGSLENQFKSKEYLALLNKESITYIVYARGDVYRQNGDREGQLFQVY